jgi:sortase A
VAIAGHRTTYGAWFRNTDRLERGDVIILRMPYGVYRYRVIGHEVVTPTSTGVLRGPPGTLVLTTCNPPYSAAQRLLTLAVEDRSPQP